MAPIINGLPKYVASTTLQEPLGWANSHLLQGDVAQAVGELKAQDGKALRVIGSGELVQTLMEQDLVDEYALMIHPLWSAVASGCSATGTQGRRFGWSRARRRAPAC